MQFTLTYDNGKNSFTYELSGDNIPESSIISALQEAAEILFPEALLVIPPPEEFFEKTEEITEEERVREALYDEVDKIIEDMYGYAE